MQRPSITAIVVDDEYNARKMLPALIDWQKHGFEFTGEASNGNEALDIVERSRPEVVFTDINMPYMDGLELARRVREHDPFVKVVIMTAYPEFEYAKQGIQLGVVDFLLKPLEPEIVSRLADDLSERISAEASHWREFREMEQQIQDQKAFLREKFLNDLIGGLRTADEQSVVERYRYFFDGEDPDVFAIAVLELEMTHDKQHEERILIEMQCKRFVDALLFDRTGIVVFADNTGRLVFLAKNTRIDLSNLAEQCVRSLKDRLQVCATVGVGNGYVAYQELGNSYREALEALRYGKLQGGNQVISFAEDLRCASTWDLRSGDIEEAIFFVKAGAPVEAGRAIEILAEVLASSRSTTLEQTQTIAIQLLSLLASALGEIGLNQARLGLLSSDLFARVLQASSLNEVTGMVGVAVVDAAETVLKSRSKKKVTMLDGIKDFLQKEFRNPEINLTMLSERFNYNSSYLSRVFKQEVGVGFTEYLMRLRVEEAAKLLEETDQKAYQIAEAVGILDPYYFSHCFKKIIGTSIQDYRRKA